MARKSLSEILGGVTRFGRLTIVGDGASPIDGRGKRQRTAICSCDCGKEADIYVGNLRSGAVQSCGCLQAELLAARATKHGDTRGARWSREYQCWAGMIQRCTNPNTKAFPGYGGRGISVCDEWRASFEQFLADMGRKPTIHHSIERIDNDGGYEPRNCRWADKRSQMRNRRSTRTINWQGREVCLQDAAEEAGLPQSTLFNRLRLGWSVERAMTTPKRHRSA